MHWDQEAIGKWADATFGPAKTAAVIAARANVEMAELLRWLAKDPSGLGDNTADEAADVAIILFRLAHHCNFDLMEAVGRKMETNLKRRWASEGDGQGRHLRVEEAHFLEGGFRP
ncbi:MAG: nucleotide pyrophosphohydrolase [Bryobacteraceae bacterium]